MEQIVSSYFFKIIISSYLAIPSREVTKQIMDSCRTACIIRWSSSYFALNWSEILKNQKNLDSNKELNSSVGPICVVALVENKQKTCVFLERQLTDPGAIKEFINYPSIEYVLKCDKEFTVDTKEDALRPLPSGSIALQDDYEVRHTEFFRNSKNEEPTYFDPMVYFEETLVGQTSSATFVKLLWDNGMKPFGGVDIDTQSFLAVLREKIGTEGVTSENYVFLRDDVPLTAQQELTTQVSKVMQDKTVVLQRK